MSTVRHPYDVSWPWQCYAMPTHLQAAVHLVVCNLPRWQHMLLMVLRATEEVASRIFVEYEALVREPVAQARRPAAFLDEHRGGAPSAAPSIRAMAARAHPAWWYHHSDRALSESVEATTTQRCLYEFVRSKVKEPGKAFVEAYPMPPGWWEFVHNIARYVAAYNRFDVDGMLALLTDDVRFENVSGGQVTASASGAVEFRQPRRQVSIVGRPER
jgi:hypothetical protein